MIETRHLRNVVIFSQKMLSFELLRKIILMTFFYFICLIFLGKRRTCCILMFFSKELLFNIKL